MNIDIKRIRESMPMGSMVSTGKNKTSVYLECVIPKRVSEEDFAMIKQWQREIIGADNISEFYTLTEGTHWFIYLSSHKGPIEITVS